jgi:hypothetical protein
MALDLSSAKFIGPALPEPFVKFDLEKILSQNNLLPKTTGEEGKKLQEIWDAYRRKLRMLGSQGGAIRVRNHVIDPLIQILGYENAEDDGGVVTREGDEDGGVILSRDGSKIRVWTALTGTDLEAPIRRGYAYRFSPVRIAQRVLLTKQERLGLITDGLELRILISDSARPDSQVIIPIDPDWKKSREVPDTFRFLLAIASPQGTEILPEIVDKARLKQATVTKELRVQARQAIENFIQEILDEPLNRTLLESIPEKEKLAKDLWHEGLIIIYRLLFVLKGDASDDPARSFGFTGSSVWRNTYSPTVSLAKFVRASIDEGVSTGTFLESGLKTIFSMFANGVKSVELNISPLGGTLFGENSTPLLSQLHWPERGCAKFLDKLLWTLLGRRGGPVSRQRIHYGSLDIEDLGRVYEALLELEPGIALERMCRLRRSKLEVVVPYEQGEKYKVHNAGAEEDAEEEDSAEEPEEEENSRSSKVQWIEEIKPGQFYLRVGLGRKSSGSYYTPHSFVRFLVQETLGPKIEECSPKEDPKPNEILKLKVIDPAMGSGHFLVEACRFMADKLYEACRLCDEKAMVLEQKAEKEENTEKKAEYHKLADDWRQRIIEIPDPEDEILKYLPSTAPEDGITGLSQSKAMALCKRLVAVHSLYGVDKNPLAVELAKLSLWLESQSEGLPLTFLDHRFVIGDSITGPFFEHLLKYPGSQEPLDDMFNQGLREKLTESLKKVLLEVNELEKSIGIDISDLSNKQKAKERLENSLLPFKILAAAWAGGVMLGPGECDDVAYANLAKNISEIGSIPDSIESENLVMMINMGLGLEKDKGFEDAILKTSQAQIVPALSYDLTFPEVFFDLTESQFCKKGFDVVLGNPPWDKIMPASKEFFAGYDIRIVASKSKAERQDIEKQLHSLPEIGAAFREYWSSFERIKALLGKLYEWQNIEIEGERSGAQPDSYRYFCEKSYLLLNKGGMVGMVLPSAFHANEGATGVRKLYLNKMELQNCYSFENKNKLFEIHSRFKFAVVVAKNLRSSADSFQAAFYIHDDNWLFRSIKQGNLNYSKDLVVSMDNKYFTFIELRSEDDLKIMQTCLSRKIETLGLFLDKFDISCGEELNKTRQSVNFERLPSLTNRDWSSLENTEILGLIIYEGRNIWQFNDRFEMLSYYFPYQKLKYRPDLISLTGFYRFGYRLIASSTNERTLIGTILTPGCVCINSIAVERNLGKRTNYNILSLCALWNTFVVDWIARQKVAANINKFFLETIPLPDLIMLSTYLTHSVLRLVSNHKGFYLLWIEQLGNNWREQSWSPFTWPVLQTGEERWEVRSAIDSVIADAYGLNHNQYEHILKSFDRASGPNPYTGICLAKFDELKEIGFETFTKKYDPYWDIPLNEELPKPVIDLPIPQEENGKDIFGSIVTAKVKGRRKQK